MADLKFSLGWDFELMGIFTPQSLHIHFNFNPCSMSVERIKFWIFFVICIISKQCRQLVFMYAAIVASHGYVYISEWNVDMPVACDNDMQKAAYKRTDLKQFNIRYPSLTKLQPQMRSTDNFHLSLNILKKFFPSWCNLKFFL